MAITKEIFDFLQKVTALELRSIDLKDHITRIDSKLDNLLDRLSRIETNYTNLRENIKNQIIGDLKAEMVKFQLEMDSILNRTPGKISDSDSNEMKNEK